MKRSEIYLRCAELLATKSPSFCGCVLLSTVGRIKYTQTIEQSKRMKTKAPEYYMFRPREKWLGKSAFITGEMDARTEWRINAFLFAHEIAKSNGN